MMIIGQPEIDFVRQNEGHIYGLGAADLITKIRNKLVFEDTNDPRKVRDFMYEVLYESSKAIGQNPDIEVVKRDSGDDGDKTYYVAWESGPCEWAIQCSFVVMECTGRLCEPYYSFDLQLYDAE